MSLNTIAGKMVKGMTNGQEITDVQFRTLQFGVESLLSELLKIIMYVIIFASVGMLDLFWIALIFACVPRLLAGGYHAKTFWSCFFVTFAGLGAAILIGSFVPLNMPIKLCIMAFIIVMAVWRAPVDNENKPIISPKRRQKLKYLSVVCFAIFGTAAIMYGGTYGNVGLMALCAEAVSLIKNDRNSR